MALPLIKGEAVGLPPTNGQVFGTDATGTPFLLNSDGSRTPFAATTGVTPSWRTCMYAAAKAKLGVNLGEDFLMDFVHGTSNPTLEYDSTAAGATLSNLTNKDGGVLQSTTAASGSVSIYPKGSPCFSFNPKTKRWAVGTRVYIENAPAANQLIHLCAFWVTALNGYVALALSGADSTAVLYFVLNDGTAVKVPTSVAPPAVGVATDFLIYGDTTKIGGAYGQVQSAAGLTDIPETATDLLHCPASPAMPLWFLFTSTATTVTASIDKLWCAVENAS